MGGGEGPCGVGAGRARPCQAALLALEGLREHWLGCVWPQEPSSLRREGHRQRGGRGGGRQRRAEGGQRQKAKAYSTRYSQAFFHPGANQARHCLASREDRLRPVQAAMAEEVSSGRWALQEPSRRVPSQAGAALHPRTRLNACLPASLLAAAGPGAGGRGCARGPWQPAVAQAPPFSNPGTLAGCSLLGPTPASASIRSAPHHASQPRTAPHHTTMGCSVGGGWK